MLHVYCYMLHVLPQQSSCRVTNRFMVSSSMEGLTKRWILMHDVPAEQHAL